MWSVEDFHFEKRRGACGGSDDESTGTPDRNREASGIEGDFLLEISVDDAESAES